MKKIISLLAALAMTASFSITSFAEIPADATNPKAAITVTDTGEDAYGYDVFKIAVSFSDLGSLTHVNGIKKGGTKLTQVDFVISGTDVVFGEIDAASTLGASNLTNSGDSEEKGGIYLAYAQTNVANCYPQTNTNKADNAIVATFYGHVGDTVNFEQVKLGYATFVNGKMSGITEYVTNITLDKTSAVLGATESKTMDMTASLKGKYENGYVWEATVTPGDNALTQFNAKFTEAGTGKTAERTVHNPGAMDFSGTGSLTFNVGLRTQKTLSGAEFTAYATADDYKTVAAPVE